MADIQDNGERATIQSVKDTGNWNLLNYVNSILRSLSTVHVNNL